MANELIRESAKKTEAQFGDALIIGITPQMYGALGDLTTNDATAFNNCFADAFTLRRPVYIPHRGYKCNSTLTIPAGVRIVAEPGAQIDFSSIAGNTPAIVNAAANTATVTNLAANASKWAATISVASAAGFAVGDLVQLESNKLWYDGASGDVTMSEMSYIKAISGTTITLWERPRYAYNTADAAKLRRLGSCRHIVIENLRWFGGGAGLNQFGARFTTCENLHLIRCRVDNFDNRCIELSNCADFVIDGGKGSRSQLDGLAYSIAVVAGSHWGRITNVFSVGGRHAVTIGGTTGVCRDIKVIGCTSHGARDAGFDCHPGSDLCQFLGNTVEANETTDIGNPATLTDGIVLQGQNHTCIGNKVTGARRHGILAQPTANTGEVCSLTIVGNELRYPAVGSTAVLVQMLGTGLLKGLAIDSNVISGGWQTAVHVQANTGGIEDVTIDGNPMGSLASKGVVIETQGSTDIRQVAITGNTMRAAAESIHLVGASAESIQDVTVTGNSAPGGTYGLRGANTEYITAVGNNFSKSTNAPTVAGSKNTIANNNTSA